MANHRSMIQIAGTTYRIQAAAQHHEVIRVRDDSRVGAFRHRPALRVVESSIDTVELLEVAKAALRAGRLPWSRTNRSGGVSPPGAGYSVSTRRGRQARTLASLLAVLWPSA